MKTAIKKIRYYKTPLCPVYDELTNMWKISFESKKGAVPKRLAGQFTAKHYAQQALDQFLLKYTIEYITDG